MSERPLCNFYVPQESKIFTSLFCFFKVRGAAFASGSWESQLVGAMADILHNCCAALWPKKWANCLSGKHSELHTWLFCQVIYDSSLIVIAVWNTIFIFRCGSEEFLFLTSSPLEENIEAMFQSGVVLVCIYLQLSFALYPHDLGRLYPKESKMKDNM